MSTRHWDVLALAAIAGAAVVSAAVYPELPERVATHFDLHGRPNGWMPRPMAAAFLPAFAAVLWAIVRFAPRVLPGADRRRLAGGIVAIVAALTAAFMAAIHVVVLRVALAPETQVTSLVCVLAGAFFVALGLVLPRVRKNPIVGIRTAWTLRSDENWARTHRVAGYAMVATGIVATIAGAIGGVAGAAVSIACLLIGGLVPAVYSFVIAKRADP